MIPRTVLTAVFMILCFTLSLRPVQAGVVKISGEITGDTIWSNADTILVEGTVNVTAISRLTVQAGTVVQFAPGTGLMVFGELTAVGNDGNRVVFTTRADTLLGSPLAGAWNGLSLQSQGPCILDYCDVRYAMNSVYTYGPTTEFRHCYIEDFTGRGLYVVGAISSTPTTVLIDHCVIRQNQPGVQGTATGIFIFRATDVTISSSEITNCSYGIDIYGYSIYRPRFQITSCALRDHTSYGIHVHSGG